MGIGDPSAAGGPGVRVNTSGRTTISADCVKKLREMDADGNGEVTLAEFISYVESKHASEKQKKALRWGICVLVGIILALIGAGLGTSIVAGEVRASFTPLPWPPALPPAFYFQPPALPPAVAALSERRTNAARDGRAPRCAGLPE